MKTIDELLIELKACKEAQEWAQGKTFEEVYNTCYRGDWLNWLFNKTNPTDVKLLTLVKGHQANTVRHLMKDERSLKAIDTAIAFGEGRATREELNNAAEEAYVAAAYAAEAAYAAAGAAEADARYAAAAAYAAVEAARAASAAGASAASAAAAARAASAAGASAAYTAAEQANQKITADIFRKYISIEKFKI